MALYSRELGIEFKEKSYNGDSNVSIPIENFMFAYDQLLDDIENDTENVGAKDMKIIRDNFDYYKSRLALLLTEVVSEIESEKLREWCTYGISKWKPDPVMPDDTCWTYVFKTKVGEKYYYKIGLSQNVDSRMKTLQGSNPTLVEEVFRTKHNSRFNASLFEKWLHEEFAPWRCKFNGATSEWFKPPVGQVIEKYKDSDWYAIKFGDNKEYMDDIKELWRTSG